MRIEHVAFGGRTGRYAYVVKRFRKLLHGRVLDVGCDQGQLKGMLYGVDYVGIDIAGAPDIRLDLEKIDRLPFADGEFDAVLCTDVLEHLDNLHFVFGELVRVTRGHLIISLPNCWRNLRKRLAEGTGTPRYYGLPVDRPEDRHKWFFNVEDAARFMEAQASRLPVRVAETFANVKPGGAVLRAARRAMYPSEMPYLNRYAHTVWTVLQKRQG